MAENMSPANQERKSTDLLTPRNVIGGLIVIVALLFIFQNTESAGLHILFFDLKAPNWLWLLGVFAAGFASGWLFSRHRRRAKANG